MSNNDKKIVAVIVCDNGLYGDAQKTIKSLNYFHPEIKVIRYATEDIKRLKDKFLLNNIDNPINFIGPLAMKEVWEKEKPSLLIKLGADTIILSQLKEALESEYDCASARNDAICVKSDERHNRPDVIRDIPNTEWVNADTIFIRSQQFLNDYVQLTLNYAYGRAKALERFGKIWPGDCQSALNVVFKLGGYKTLILDKFQSGLVYNASGNWTGENNDDKPASLEGAINNWAAWKFINLNENNEPILPDLGCQEGERKVRILHSGGGYHAHKLAFDLFNPEFQKHLEKITGFKE